MMSDYIEEFKSKIDSNSVRVIFPEMTDSAVAVWQGAPAVISMADKYV